MRDRRETTEKRYLETAITREGEYWLAIDHSQPKSLSLFIALVRQQRSVKWMER